MRKKSILDDKKIKKGGYRGNGLWKAHRLEGVVKNKAIKPVKKKRKNKTKQVILNKNYNPNKIHRKIIKKSTMIL